MCVRTKRRHCRKVASLPTPTVVMGRPRRCYSVPITVGRFTVEREIVNKFHRLRHRHLPTVPAPVRKPFPLSFIRVCSGCGRDPCLPQAMLYHRAFPKWMTPPSFEYYRGVSAISPKWIGRCWSAIFWTPITVSLRVRIYCNHTTAIGSSSCVLIISLILNPSFCLVAILCYILLLLWWW